MRQNSHAAKLTPVNKAYNSVISLQPQGRACSTTAPVLVSPEGHAAARAVPLPPPHPRLLPPLESFSQRCDVCPSGGVGRCVK